MMRTVVFVAGVAVGVMAASQMSDEQRQRLQDKMPSLGKGARTNRLRDAAQGAVSSVADAAVGVVETAADKVQQAAGSVPGSSGPSAATR